jgi:uncharacterized membrane protein YhaH (DUF805 family)
VTERVFQRIVLILAAGFVVFFAAVVIPGLIDDPNVLDALGDGFVNPFAAGYSTDVIVCALILATWILYERRAHQIRGGLWCILLSFVPGVAVGFGVYLVLRSRQLRPL